MSSLYSVVLFDIPDMNINNYTILRDSITTEFNRIIKENELNKLHQLFCNPNKINTNIKPIRYIFIGNYNELADKSIESVLNEIETSKVLTETNSQIIKQIYNDDIVDSIKTIIKESTEYEQSIKFVPYQLVDDDTINTINNYMTLIKPNLFSEYIHLFADTTEYQPLSLKYELQNSITKALVGYINVTHKGSTIPSISDIKNVLWSFGVPMETLDNIIDNKFSNMILDEPSDIVKLINEPIIFEWLKMASVYTSPAYYYTYIHKDLLYNVWSNPFLYMSDDIYYKDSMNDAKKFVTLNKKGLNYTIGDIALSKNRTFYMYNLNDFRNISTDENYGNFFMKFFPLWNKKWNTDDDYSSLVKLNKSAYKNQNITSSALNIFKKSSIVSAKDETGIYMELHHQIYYEKKIDLLNIFNNIVPSWDMPIILFRDPQTKDMVYKIYRPITQKKNKDDIDFPVSYNEIQRWINYVSYNVDDDRIKEIKDIVRGLQVKFLWKVSRYDNIVRSGSVYEIYKNTNQNEVVTNMCSILYNNKIIRDVPVNTDFILNLPSNIKKDDIVKFYQPHNTYIDIMLENNGSITVKVPFKYSNVIHHIEIHKIIEDWLIGISKLTNNYIKSLFNTPNLNKNMDIWYDSKSLTLSTYELYKRYMCGTTYIQNLSYKYVLKVPSDCNIIYNDFIHILRFFNNMLIINDTILKKEDPVEYYDAYDKRKWMKVSILNYNIDSDDYNIFYDNKTIKNVKRNFLRIASQQVSKYTTNQIKMTYRKVSDFNILNTIQQFILKTQQWKYPKEEIILKIANEFNIDISIADMHYNNYTEKVKILSYLKFETGIEITIDYLDKIKISDSEIGYKVNILNIHSLSELKNIEKIMNFIMTVYIYYKYENYRKINNNTYIQYLATLFTKTEQVILTSVTEEPKADLDEIIIDTNINLDEIMDAFDIDASFTEETINTEEFIEEKKESYVEEKKESATDESILQSELTARKGKPISDILQELYNHDYALFGWSQTETPKDYPTGCQAGSQPVVLTDSLKTKVDNEHPNSYGNKEQIMCDPNDPEFMNKLSKSTSKNLACSAIKWGSTPENQNWYVCPKIYDSIDKVPLSIADLKFEIAGFESKDDLQGWRTDKTTGKDITDFKPSYKGRLPIPAGKSIGSKTNSIFFVRTDKNYNPYPGFMKPYKKSDSSVIYPLCCYLKSSNNLKEVFIGQKTKEKAHGEYILQWGKELDKGRSGYLSDFLYNCFDTERCSNTNLICMKRVGAEKGNRSLLSAFSYYSGINNYNQLLKHILTNINNNVFIRLNRGQLKTEFKTAGLITSFQNYIEYTLSNEFKELRHYYDLLTGELDFPECPKGFNLLIIEYSTSTIKKDEYTYNIVLPYYISNKPKKTLYEHKNAVLLKNGDTGNYEVIEFDGNFLFNWGEFPHIDSMIEYQWEFLYKSRPSMNDSPVNLSLIKSIRDNSVLYFADIYKYLTETEKIPFKCVYDGYQVIAVYIDSLKLIVPVYPNTLLSNKNICPVKNMIQLEELINNRNSLSLKFEQYKEIIEGLMKKLNKKISFRHVYRETKTIVSGVMTSYAVYVPLADTDYDKNIKLPTKTNAFKVMKNISDTEQIINEQQYSKPANIKSVLRFLEIQGFNDYSIVKNGDLYDSIILNKTKKNKLRILLPINPISEAPENINVEILNKDEHILTSLSPDDYLKYAETIYIKSKKIPVRPLRLYMDVDKRIFKGFLLETGDIIEFEPEYHISLDKEYFSLESINNLQTIVNNVIMNNLVGKISQMNLTRDQPYYVDKRISSNKTVQYQLDIYDYILKILNEFFKLNGNIKYADTINQILKNPLYTRQSKMRLIKPIYMAIMKILFKYGESDYDKCIEGFETKLPPINNVKEYVWSIYFMTLGDNKTVLSNKFGLSEIENKEVFYENFKNASIEHDKEIAIIEQFLLPIYKRLYDDHNGKISCVYEINKNIINVDKLVEQILNDMIKNNIVRDSIFNIYSKIENIDRYILHPEADEIILKMTDGANMWNILMKLYDQSLHIYYMKMLTLNDINYDTVFTINITEGDKLKKKNIYNQKFKKELISDDDLSVMRIPDAPVAPQPLESTPVVPITKKEISPVVTKTLKGIQKPIIIEEIKESIVPITEENKLENQVFMDFVSILEDYSKTVIKGTKCENDIFLEFHKSLIKLQNVRTKRLTKDEVKLILETETNNMNIFKEDMTINRIRTLNMPFIEFIEKFKTAISNIINMESCISINLIIKFFDSSYIHNVKDINKETYMIEVYRDEDSIHFNKFNIQPSVNDIMSIISK
jgi:hypothetical protein